MDTFPGIGQHFGSLLPTPPPLHSNTNKGRMEATSLLALGGCSGRGKTLMSSVMLEHLNQGWTPLSVVSPPLPPTSCLQQKEVKPQRGSSSLGCIYKGWKGNAVTFKISLPMWAITFCLIMFLRRLQDFALVQLSSEFPLTNFSLLKVTYFTSKQLPIIWASYRTFTLDITVLSKTTWDLGTQWTQMASFFSLVVCWNAAKEVSTSNPRAL